MGIDPNTLPDSVITKMDKRFRPKGRLTAEEALRKEELRTERDHQAVFTNWLNLCTARGELVYEHDQNDKPTTNIVGWPDYRIYLFGPMVVCVEFKSTVGRLSHDQEMLKGVLESFRFKYYVVRTDKEAIELVQKDVRSSLTKHNHAIAQLRLKQQMDANAYREKMRRIGSAGAKERWEKNP